MPTQDVRDALDFEEEGVFSQLSVVATHKSKAKAELMVKTALDHMRRTSSGLSFTMAEQQMSQLEAALAKKEQEVLVAQSEFSDFQKSLKTAPDPANPLSTTQYLARLQQIESQLGLVRKKLEVARKLASKPEIKNPDLPSGIPDRDRYRNQIVQLEYQLQVAKIKGGPRNPAVIALERELQLAKLCSQC
jgi:septal ring factor EnvC (AmiA/AmiB activator)